MITIVLTFYYRFGGIIVTTLRKLILIVTPALIISVVLSLYNLLANVLF